MPGRHYPDVPQARWRDITVPRPTDSLRSMYWQRVNLSVWRRQMSPTPTRTGSYSCNEPRREVALCRRVLPDGVPPGGSYYFCPEMVDLFLRLRYGGRNQRRTQRSIHSTYPTPGPERQTRVQDWQRWRG